MFRARAGLSFFSAGRPPLITRPKAKANCAQCRDLRQHLSCAIYNTIRRYTRYTLNDMCRVWWFEHFHLRIGAWRVVVCTCEPRDFARREEGVCRSRRPHECGTDAGARTFSPGVRRGHVCVSCDARPICVPRSGLVILVCVPYLIGIRRTHTHTHELCVRV